MAQERVTDAEEASLNRDKSGNLTILKSIKLAEPTTSTAQHKQTDLNFLRERAEVSSSNNETGNFTCPDGTEPSCLDPGDNVCPNSAKCVENRATCFDEYPCDLSGGFVCAFQYENVMKGYKQAVGKYDELASENVDLRERRLAQKNCVLNASDLEDARRCVR
jgi:hypothetical protein